MKKLFLIPLMAMLCTVMAWGTTRTAGTFAALQEAISASSAGDVIELTADVTYPTNGTGLVNIDKSITLDGKGHTLYGYGTANIAASGAADNYPTALAVNAAVFDAVNAPTLNVTIKNLTLGNIKNEYWPNGTQKAMVNSPARFYGLTVYDGVASLIMDNVNILVGRKDNNNNKDSQPGGWHQMFCITGINSTPLDLTFTNSHIYAGEGKYPVYVLKPIDATLENSIFEGYCALYFKYRASGVYGNVVGSRGSTINADACAFNAPNVHDGRSNSFAIFPLEDDGITFNLHNCSYNAEKMGNQYQMFISLQYLTRESGFQPVVFNLSGDNTHVYNVNLSSFATTGWHDNDDEHLDTYVPEVNIPFELNISGGTYTINPEDITFHTYVDGTTFGIGHATIVDGYEASEANQGGVTVYRVVKKAEEKSPGVKYDLNDDVPTDEPGAGNNPASSFDLSTGTTMELNQATTEAGYVQVKDNGSSVGTTVKVGKTVAETKVNQTLVINNGLDVLGNSTVEVQSGSTLQIGEGGITTQSSGNIVIEADEQGAGSLLLDPTITVNQNPNLTVKMLAKQIGRDASDDFFWHRFAMPVLHIENWDKEGTLVAANPASYTVQYPTYVYAWDYNENDWKNIHPSQMVALQGYTLTLASDYIHVDGAGKVVSEGSDGGNLNVRQDVYYTFKGNLVGNTDQKLTFASEGFNFFGNSYTGYMHALTVINGIESDHVDNTIYMWNGEAQNYVGVSKYKLEKGRGLEAWQTEIAPMQTFILRLRGADDADESVSYASAIWGNPRYGNVAPAPARLSSVDEEDAYLEIKVTAANGKSDKVDFTEMASKSDAFESAYDAEKYMNRNSLNLYADVEGINLSSVVTDDLIGKTLSMQTVNEVNYTMTFANVEGNEYALLDKATNEVIAITNDAVYTFSAQPNSTVENRFEIVAIAKAPTAVENTESSVKARGIYTMLGQYMGEDITVLPAGVYVVNGVKIVK